MILMFENMAVVHEWHLGRGGMIKPHENFGKFFHQNNVFPAGLRWAWRSAVVAQDSEARAVHMKRVRHGGRSDLPDFGRSALGRDIDPVHIESAAIDAHHLGCGGMVVTGVVCAAA